MPNVPPAYPICKLPFCINKLVPAMVFAVPPPFNVHVPVITPVVAFAPVEIIAVFSVEILPVVRFPVVILAFALTDILVNIPFAPVTLPLVERFPAVNVPVTLTVPNVVVPPLPDCASVIHELAVVVPSAGQTHNVLAFVLYHSWPCNGFDGGEALAKFSTA